MNCLQNIGILIEEERSLRVDTEKKQSIDREDDFLSDIALKAHN